MGNSLSSADTSSTSSNTKNLPQDFTMSVPFQTSSVKIVRLILAGIANHMEFSSDELEDLKIAIGEVFNFYLRHSQSSAKPNILVKATTSQDKLTVKIFADGMFVKEEWEASTVPEPSSEVSSLTILEFLVDDISIFESNSGSVIQFVKISDVQ